MDFIVHGLIYYLQHKTVNIHLIQRMRLKLVLQYRSVPTVLFP